MSDLLAWMRTRMLRWPIGALCGLLMMLLAAIGTPQPLLISTLLVGLLVTSFRLWDDLQDRAHDRTHWPDRVLVCSPTVGHIKIVAACAIALAAVTIALGYGADSLFLFLALVVALSLMYRYIALPRSMRESLLGLKYPFFLLVLARDPLSAPSLIAAVFTYAMVLAYAHFEQRTQSA